MFMLSRVRRGISAIRRQDAAETDSATKFIITIAILLIFQTLGETVVYLLDVPIPGGVAGLAFFLLYLGRRGSVPAGIGYMVPIFLRHLSLFFIPAGVGVIAYFDQLSSEWVGLGLTIAASTLLTIAVTAAVFELASRISERKSQKGAQA